MKKEQLITIVVVLVLIISAIYLIKYFKYDAENEKISTNTSNEIYCNNDLDCVPAGCCHPNSCVNVNYKPECSGIICSQVCAPGSLDCGQGSCLCINNKCNAIKK